MSAISQAIANGAVTFDPRAVPIVGTGAHLPAVALHRLTAESLKQRFASPPEWTPEVLREASFSQREQANAAVLLPLVMRDELTVLLTQRTLHLTTHAGQIAFPGGKVDVDDADDTATALRETHEEVGLRAEYIQVIGKLPPYVTGTHFVISPVVALIQPDFELNLNPNEVAQAFEVPLSFLMNPTNHNEHAMHFQGTERRWFSMPYDANASSEAIDVQAEHFIWGATAGMLRNFYRFLIA